ncbi:unnamed protein product, partial [Coccothraustes coccothraustes]
TNVYGSAQRRKMRPFAGFPAAGRGGLPHGPRAAAAHGQAHRRGGQGRARARRARDEGQLHAAGGGRVPGLGAVRGAAARRGGSAGAPLQPGGTQRRRHRHRHRHRHRQRERPPFRNLPRPRLPGFPRAPGVPRGRERN